MFSKLLKSFQQLLLEKAEAAFEQRVGPIRTPVRLQLVEEHHAVVQRHKRRRSGVQRHGVLMTLAHRLVVPAGADDEVVLVRRAVAVADDEVVHGQFRLSDEAHSILLGVRLRRRQVLLPRVVVRDPRDEQVGGQQRPHVRDVQLHADTQHVFAWKLLCVLDNPPLVVVVLDQVLLHPLTVRAHLRLVREDVDQLLVRRELVKNLAHTLDGQVRPVRRRDAVGLEDPVGVEGADLAHSLHREELLRHLDDRRQPFVLGKRHLELQRPLVVALPHRRDRRPVARVSDELQTPLVVLGAERHREDVAARLHLQVQPVRRGRRVAAGTRLVGSRLRRRRVADAPPDSVVDPILEAGVLAAAAVAAVVCAPVVLAALGVNRRLRRRWGSRSVVGGGGGGGVVQPGTVRQLHLLPMVAAVRLLSLLVDGSLVVVSVAAAANVVGASAFALTLMLVLPSMAPPALSLGHLLPLLEAQHVVAHNQAAHQQDGPYHDGRDPDAAAPPPPHRAAGQHVVAVGLNEADFPAARHVRAAALPACRKRPLGTLGACAHAAGHKRQQQSVTQ
eukprot:Rhum_TRINITY_DN15185_c2_g2::Rhum_TRINITY_DN15185_c2_g2_i1::g.142843::m.142843